MKKKVTETESLKKSIKESAEKLRGIENFIPVSEPVYKDEYEQYHNKEGYLSIVDVLAPIGLVLGFISFGIVLGLLHAV